MSSSSSSFQPKPGKTNKDDLAANTAKKVKIRPTPPADSSAEVDPGSPILTPEPTKRPLSPTPSSLSSAFTTPERRTGASFFPKTSPLTAPVSPLISPVRKKVELDTPTKTATAALGGEGGGGGGGVPSPSSGGVGASHVGTEGKREKKPSEPLDLAAPKIKKKRGRKPNKGDGGWSRRSESRGGNNKDGLKQMRGIKERKEEKLAAKVSASPLKDTSPRTYLKAKRQIAKTFEGIGFRPLVEHEVQTPTGPKKEFRTPEGGTRMWEKHRYQSVCIYSDRAPLASPSKPVVTDLTQDRKDEIVGSEIVRATIKPDSNPMKVVVLTLTKKLLDKTKRELLIDPVRRPDQVTTLTAAGSKKRASPTEYGRQFLSQPEHAKVMFEWCHLICHSVIGNSAQDVKNLGCGTFHYNSHAMLVEETYPMLVKAFPEGIKLEVKGECVQDSHMLIQVHYGIQITDPVTKKLLFNLKFSLNAQSLEAPDLRCAKAIQAYVTTCIEAHLRTLDVPDNASPVRYSPFFRTPERHRPAGTSSGSVVTGPSGSTSDYTTSTTTAPTAASTTDPTSVTSTTGPTSTNTTPLPSTTITHQTSTTTPTTTPTATSTTTEKTTSSSSSSLSSLLSPRRR